MPLNRRQFLKMSTGTIAGLTFLKGGGNSAYADRDPSTSYEWRFAIYKEDYPAELKHSSGATLKLDPTLLLLEYKESYAQMPKANFEFDRRLQRAGLVPESFHFQEKNAPPSYRTRRVNDTDVRRWWSSAIRSSALEIESVYRNIEAIGYIKESLQEPLEWSAPVYRFSGEKDYDGRICPLPHVLVIKPALKVRVEDLDQVLRQFQLDYLPEISQYLGDYRFYVLQNPAQRTVYPIKEIILKQYRHLVQEVQFDFTPLHMPIGCVPNDPLYRPDSSWGFLGQWNMTRIMAGGDPNTSGITGCGDPSAGVITGWDIARGQNTVVAVIDTGCDLDHPDFIGAFSSQGATFGDPQITPYPTLDSGRRKSQTDPIGHGTCCAGILGARCNDQGVVGVANMCTLMSLNVGNGFDQTSVVAAINYAAQQKANVISMSFGGEDNLGGDYLNSPMMTQAIETAFKANIVLCAATMNENTSSIYYPASHPLVIACGASNNSKDKRCDENDWGSGGSNYGEALSVVAPGVNIPTTYVQGEGRISDGPGGGWDYYSFERTSAATPHVAGLAALLFSKFPSLRNDQIRNIIEQTADYIFQPSPSISSTTTVTKTTGGLTRNWNQETGFGRINVLAALRCPPSDHVDVMIKSWSGDTGQEPANPPGGDFWTSSDIVVRPTDDNVFVPGDVMQSSVVTRGQVNFLYVGVTNNSQGTARNVGVSVRIIPWVGLEFVFPMDWTIEDTVHESPTPMLTRFDTVPSGGTAMAKFSISPQKVENLWGWVARIGWHPCVLAEVKADNDYSLGSPSLTGGSPALLRNNLAQRNLSVIAVQAGTTTTFPILAGHRNNVEDAMDIVIERGSLPEASGPSLGLDESEEIPTGIVLPEIGRIGRVGQVSAEGGSVVRLGGKRYVETQAPRTIVRMQKSPKDLYVFALRTRVPINSEKGQRYVIKISQRNKAGKTVGGATVVYVVGETQ